MFVIYKLRSLNKLWLLMLYIVKVLDAHQYFRYLI